MQARVGSLRARLLWLLLLVVSAVWLLALAAAWIEAHHELDELLDQRLEQTAALLLELEIDNVAERTTRDDDEDGDSDSWPERLQYQVWRRDGKLLLRSATAPALPFQMNAGFQSIEHHGEQWQSFGLWSPDGERMARVFDDEGRRRQLTAEIIGRVAWPLALALPLLAALIWGAVTRSLHPIRELSRAVETRGANHLTPLPVDDLPDEVRPLVRSLNDLLERLGRSLEAEKRFTADAAHELRTPLAAIRAQAQVAQASTDAAERARALTGIVDGTDRATRLAVQLLTLARADRDAPLPHTQVDLGEVARASVARRAEAALQRRQQLSFKREGACMIEGEADLLEALCGNVIDNALAYVPDGGRIEVDVTQSSTGVLLRIVDDGPGVEAPERDRLLHRFYRATTRPDDKAAGSGLGLAIVGQIALRHKATLQLTEGLDGGGFGVTVAFASRQ